MDNFSGHIPLDQLPNHIQLRNTTVFYLPPNATSKIQPCDAGIIHSLKTYYCRRFNRLPNHIQLRNTTIFYLPPNATSKIQPCDVGIIRSFKAYYHRRFNRLLLERLGDNVANREKIDILCAIQMVVRTWTYEVKPETIFNYFCHSKIRSTKEPIVDASEECPLDPEVIEDLESQIRQFHYHNPMDIRNLLNYPEE
jgi:hypothetical protein